MPDQIAKKISRRLRLWWQECKDSMNTEIIKLLNQWPSDKEIYLMVGSESSGTTAISSLLFQEISGLRFLDEGRYPWVWDTYQEVYQGNMSIEDYPKLQLFDAIKVPGFAAILPQFRVAFPKTRVIYVIRDPRDYINSAIKTWGVDTVDDLTGISWVKENWLKIQSQDPVERLALRWKRYINTAMAENGIIYVKYEDFCRDKISTIEKLASLLDIPFNKDRIARICETQLCHESVRPYEPLGPGGWKNGILQTKHIETIEKLCGSEMSKWGYTTNHSP